MAIEVLIIDADPVAAQITCAMVMHVFPDAVATIETRASMALERTRDRRPDLIIIDPASLRQSAGDVLRALRLCCPHTCLIVLASAPTPALRRTATQIGVDAYMEKPVLLPEFADRLRVALHLTLEPVTHQPLTIPTRNAI